MFHIFCCCIFNNPKLTALFSVSSFYNFYSGIYNYRDALRHVRPHDWSADLMLRTLHDYKMFAHPSLSPRVHKEMFMNFFDQVNVSYFASLSSLKYY